MDIFNIFPKRGVKVSNNPSSLQNLDDFEVNLSWLSKIISLRKLPGHNTKPAWMQYSSLKPFRDLCFNVCKEFANNNESGVSKDHKERYIRCHQSLKDCINLFERNRDIMNFDMSDKPLLGNGDDAYIFEEKKNWYKLIYDTLLICERQFAKLMSKMEPSNVDTTEGISDAAKSEIKTAENFPTHFENKFDDVNSSEVYEHFSQLVKKRHLSEVDLQAYLKVAFEEKREPETQLKFENVRNKQAIVKIFYSYYNTTAAKPSGRKPDYVKLLTDYFKGYDYKTTSTNFSK